MRVILLLVGEATDLLLFDNRPVRHLYHPVARLEQTDEEHGGTLLLKLMGSSP